MAQTPEWAASAVEELDCPTCDAPAGSPCRTRSGRTAIKYHIPRFLLVPALRDEHEVEVPADRGPGRPWRPGAGRPAQPIRIGYAYATPDDDLADQLTALRAARCRRILAEQVGIRVRTRPELDTAVGMAIGLHRTNPDRAVVLSVHDLTRFARGTSELVARSAALRDGGIGLELLTGALAGTHQPADVGVTLFTVLAQVGELERAHRRAKTVAGQQVAAAAGRRGGRPRVFDDELLALARALHEQGVPVPEIAARLTITTGKNAGRHPSIASVYRALADSPEPAAATK